MTAPAEITSVPGVCEVERWTAPGADSEAPPDLLIEVPHGATRAADYHAVRRRLAGDLPDDLIDFFFVNTDVGAPECAREIAAAVVAPSDHPRAADLLGADALAAVAAAPRSVLVLRCLVPRTFVDCNRALQAADPDYATTGVTKAVQDYVTDPADVRLLTELHAAYHRVASSAFDWICGAGGSALTFHTYAPRSIHLERFDHGIAAALRAAYAPGIYERWPERPAVDLITEAEDGSFLAPPERVRAVKANYAAIGIAAAENASYRLHPATMGYRFSALHPGRVLCVELNRALLAAPFSPFEEMTIGRAEVARMAAPIAAAYLTPEC